MRRIPLVLQSETDECGLACLAMVAGFFGQRHDLVWLRSRFSLSKPDPNLRSILMLARELSLDARPLRASVSELAQLRLPAILHWQFDHFVVLSHVGRRGAEILDPALGRRRMRPAEISDAFTGVAVEFSRLPEFSREPPQRRLSLLHVLRGLPGIGRYLAIMLVLMFTSQVLALAVPVAIQLLIDEVVLGQDERWLMGVVAGIGLVMLSSILIDTLRRMIALLTGVRLSLDTAAAVVGHVLRLPAERVGHRPVADLMSRVESLRPILKVVSDTLVSGAVQFVILTTTLALMAFYSPLLTLVSVTAIVTMLGVQAALLPRTRERNLAAVVEAARADQSLMESLRAFPSVRACDLGVSRLSHWRACYVRANNAAAGQGRLAIVTSSTQAVIAATDQLVFLWLGIRGIIAGDITLGVLFALFSLRGRLSAALLTLVGVVHDVYLARSHIDRVGELIAEAPEPAASDTAIRQRFGGSIRCLAVGYRYRRDVDLLSGIDCRIAAGERIVITGASGVGKSTLLGLLSGEIKPDKGAIQYDGLDAGLWDTQALRRQFGVVRQCDRLLMGTIVENLSCFDASPDIERVRDAAAIACIWDEILRLPLKLDTPLSENGSGLSGGQIQRLMIARALYRQPAVLFLDEATSHLDPATAARVFANLAALDATVVAVAHGNSARALRGRLWRLRRRARGNSRRTIP